MKRPWSRARAAALLLSLAVLTSACAMAPKREIVDVAVRPETSLPQGPAVVIAEVRDSRTFVASDPKAKDAAPQQLVTGGSEDPLITARAIAQIRDASARPFVDVLLPEGRTAMDLVRDALANGFRLAGIRVLAPDDPDAATAVPISAEIVRFWSWNTGSWTFTFHFEADVKVRGAFAPFDPERLVEGRTTLHSAVAAGPGSFLNTTTKGLENFTSQVADAIAASPRSEGPSGAGDSAQRASTSPARVALQELRAEVLVAPRLDRGARSLHEALVEVHVVDRGEDRAQHLVGGEQVMQVGAREAAGAGGAVAARIDRVGVAAVLAIREPQPAARGEDARRARVARRNHAIEQVDAVTDRGDQVLGQPDTH